MAGYNKRTQKELVADLRKELREVKSAGAAALTVANRETREWKAKYEFSQWKIVDNRKKHRMRYFKTAIAWKAKLKSTIRTELAKRVQAELVRINANHLLKSAASSSGILAYPFIYKYGRDNNFSDFEFPVFIIVCILGKVRPVTYVKLGYSKRSMDAQLRRLHEWGLLERFGDDYVPSRLGLEFYKEFEKYFKKHIKALTGYEKRIGIIPIGRGRKSNTGVERNLQYIYTGTPRMEIDRTEGEIPA